MVLISRDTVKQTLMLKRPIEKVLKSYRWYCYLSVGFSCFVMAIATAGYLLGRFAPIDPEPAESLKNMGGLLFFVSIVLVFFSLRVLRLKRTRWAYIEHMTNIALGVTTNILAPFCLGLLMEWMTPEVRAYFENPTQPEFDLTPDKLANPESKVKFDL